MTSPSNRRPSPRRTSGTENTKQIKRWRSSVKVHPAAELFPPISEVELRQLAADIEKHGLRDLVVLYDDPEIGKCVLRWNYSAEK
jgi:hypothetical protein